MVFSIIKQRGADFACSLFLLHVLSGCPESDSKLRLEIGFEYLWLFALWLTVDLFPVNVLFTSCQQHLLSVQDGKLVSKRLFPLMHFHFKASSFHWQSHLKPGSWLCHPCSAPMPLQSGATGQTDRQLWGEIFSCVETYLSCGTIGSQHWQQMLIQFMMSNVRIPSRHACFHWLQTVPTVTWTLAMACYSKHYYKFDNISNYCQKSANINSS